MAPLFDNGSIKENKSLERTMITTLGRSKREDIMYLLYTRYYKYISEFSKKIEIKGQKYLNGEANIISEIYSCISETLIKPEAISYQHIVVKNLITILKLENFQNIQHQINHERQQFI